MWRMRDKYLLWNVIGEVTLLERWTLNHLPPVKAFGSYPLLQRKKFLQTNLSATPLLEQSILIKHKEIMFAVANNKRSIIRPKPNVITFPCWIVIAQQENDKRWVAFNINTQQMTSPQTRMLMAFNAISDKFDSKLWKNLPPLNQHNKLHTCKSKYINGQWIRMDLPLRWRYARL